MIDNVSQVFCFKIFLSEYVCTFCFDPMFPFSLIMLHCLLCFLLSRLKTEADIGIFTFHITFTEFIYFHILKVRT